tara:strand:- start:1201 stop:2766 length:1566 start_codon:yes stop_codon:yes gene_type:complete
VVTFQFSYPIELGILIILDWVFILFFLTGIRFISRVVRDNNINTIRTDLHSNNSNSLLIIGAGDAGINLFRNIKENKNINYSPVAFADDDETKIGSFIQDIPVAGKISEIPRIISRFNVQSAVLAIPSATTAQKSNAINILKECGTKFEILPSTPDVLAGNVSTNKIRAVNPLDILGRTPAKLNSEVLTKFIEHKCVLITGAGGSVGSDLARQVSKFEPESLIILDQIENPLLFLESEIKVENPTINLITIIADITDNIDIEKILANHKPDILLHAAAHKHVPFMETNPVKAVKNNIGGTLSLGQLAIKYDVEKFVFVSTDKAANPSSVMGTTKRVGELIMNELNTINTKTQFASVRFGNVFGSNASVVPIFKNQIESGGPVTVTDPEVTRYFMSIQEASGLILQAGAIADGGEIFVLDMGDPIKILDLAKTMISIYDLNDKIEIKFTGLRSGEKLNEILNTEFETLTNTEYHRISKIQSNQKQVEVIDFINILLDTLNDITNKQLIESLQKIVPNYTPIS